MRHHRPTSTHPSRRSPLTATLPTILRPSTTHGAHLMTTLRRPLPSQDRPRQSTTALPDRGLQLRAIRVAACSASTPCPRRLLHSPINPSHRPTMVLRPTPRSTTHLRGTTMATTVAACIALRGTHHTSWPPASALRLSPSKVHLATLKIAHCL